jgi:trypsin
LILFQTGGSIMNVQQEVELVVFSDEECDSIHGGKPHPTNICAGVPGGGKGQCSVREIWKYYIPG